MTIARGQMNRQLYQDGTGIMNLDIPMSEKELLRDNLEAESLDYIEDDNMSDEDKNVMELLMKLQENPDYQYDEENMYEGPRDMRMGGGIMTLRQPYGFGSFVSSALGGIGDAVGSVVGGIGDAVSSIDLKEALDIAAQVGSFVPGPHQPFAAAYTGARGSGVGGSDFGGLQIGGFTPSGGSFGMGGGGGSPFANPFQATQTGANTAGSLSNIDFSDALKLATSVNDNRNIAGQKNTGGGGSSTAGILGKVIQGGLSLYGAKKSYDDQKRINEQRQKEYDRFKSRQDEKRRQYETGEGLASLDVSNRTAAAGGGMMDLDVRTNPQGIREIDYRKKGGFVPPIGIKEKADDIPAMLSNNEFVFTADAVRAAGNGNVNKGAKKMYSMMKQLEGKA